MQYILPKLANDNDFEDLVRDVYIKEFRNPNLQRYGRSGQKQDGIDIIGIAGINYQSGKPTVIQCKNHVNGISDTSLISEIETELEKFDKSIFKNDDYLFVTSADNSKPVIDHCAKITGERIEQGKPGVQIHFWDFVADKALKNRDILHAYYSDKFPLLPPDFLVLPDDNLKHRKTVRIKLDELRIPGQFAKFKKDVLDTCKQNLGVSAGVADPYQPYMGIYTNPRVNFVGMVDFEIDATSFVDGVNDLENKYDLFKQGLIKLVEVLQDPFYAKNIIVRSDMEINLAFILGRAFRRSGIKLYASFKDMLLTVDGKSLASVPSKIQEQFIFSDNSSAAEDCVFVFSSALNTNITRDVTNYISTWRKPILLRAYFVNDGKVNNTAHAASIASDLCGKLHNLQFQGIKRIHVFLAVPKPLGMLIGYGLNTLNTELHLYFMAPDRSIYLRTGIIDNRTFGGI